MLAAVIVGCAVALKPIVAPLILLFVWERRWRELVTSAGLPLALSLILLPFVDHPEQIVTRGLPYVLHATATDPANASVGHLVAQLGGPDWLAIAVRVSLVTVMLCVARRSHRRGQAPVYAATALLLAGLFASTIVWSHHMLVLVPGLVILTRRPLAPMAVAAWLLLSMHQWGGVFPAAGSIALAVTLSTAILWPDWHSAKQHAPTRRRIPISDVTVTANG